MAKPRNLLFKSCSVLLAALFAISTLAQFDDPDWYFWIPLYAAACLVNLANGVSKYKKMRQIAKVALLFGLFLLIKLFIQDFVQGIAGFLSLDMREKVVGGKIGSGIVIISMFLQLQASSEPYKVNKATGSNNVRVGTYVKYGMALLVGIGYGTAFGMIYSFFVVDFSTLSLSRSLFIGESTDISLVQHTYQLQCCFCGKFDQVVLGDKRSCKP